MTAPDTNLDIAYQLQTYLLTLPAQVDQVREAIESTGNAHALRLFDELCGQLKEQNDLTLEAVRRLAQKGETQ